MEVKPGFQDAEKVSLSKRCPFSGGNKYKDYVKIFPGPNFVCPEWSCPKGEVSLYSKTITVGADVVDQCTLQAKFWNLSSLFYSGLLQFKKGFYERVLMSSFHYTLLVHTIQPSWCMKGLRERDLILRAHMVLFFWQSHSLELDLMNQPAKKKFVGRILEHVYRSKW